MGKSFLASSPRKVIVRTVVIPAAPIVYLTTTTTHAVVVGHLNIYVYVGEIYLSEFKASYNPAVAAAVKRSIGEVVQSRSRGLLMVESVY